MDRSSLFQLIQEQLDPDNTGFIAVENFTSLVEHHELQLDPSKLDMLLALVQSNEEGQVCYQELIELVSGDRLTQIWRQIAMQGESLEAFHVPQHTPIFPHFPKGYRIDSGRAGKLCSGEN
ncbi:hypothetical protein JOQ06_027032 [Pogonophryne albipinna]|uniref:rhomboid protease n=1 Tax=Pogonophryne albipinna TaxID=1090488 RepID=A0AAD6FNA9_9TELE|nr:hypothetical protein JOQ06_027032 [Pogonophryne albipinna]